MEEGNEIRTKHSDEQYAIPCLPVTSLTIQLMKDFS